MINENENTVIDMVKNVLIERPATVEFPMIYRADYKNVYTWYMKTYNTLLINTFIETWLSSELDNIKVETIESDPVTYGLLVNISYVWKITNDHAIIMIAFNDFDFKFNSQVSFETVVDDNNFYTKEVKAVSVDECIAFIVKEITSVYKNIF